MLTIDGKRSIENQFTILDIEEEKPQIRSNLPDLTKPKRDLSQPDDYFAIEEEKKQKPVLTKERTASF